MPFELESLEQISLRIRATRKAANVSQQRLAKMCGLSQSTIARVEKDVKELNPSYSTIFNIIYSLGSISKRAGSEAILSKKAYEIMHKQIVSIKPNSTISEAIALFKDYDFQQLPVLDSGKRIIGTVYKKDLLTIATQSPDLVTKRIVASVMKAPLPQIDRDTEIIKIKPILENWDAIIVVKNGKAIGIVTIYDILKNV